MKISLEERNIFTVFLLLGEVSFEAVVGIRGARVRPVAPALFEEPIKQLF